jgi:hypothetical protein
MAAVSGELPKKLTKENVHVFLGRFIEIANLKGAYALQESNILTKAIDYLSPEVKNKPTLREDDPNPRATALDLLVKGALKAQKEGAFFLRDSAALYEIVELARKSLEESDGETGGKTPAPTTPAPASHGDDADDEEEIISSKPLPTKSRRAQPETSRNLAEF